MSDESSHEGSPVGTELGMLKCPVPPEHVKLFQDCCEKYQAGEMTDLDVMIEVANTLRTLKKT